MSKVPPETNFELRVLIISRVKLQDPYFRQEVLMTDLGLFLDKHVIEDLHKALHGLRKWQITVGSEELKIEVTLCHFTLGIQSISFLQLLFVLFALRLLYARVFPIDKVLLKELNQYFLSELAPELTEKVPRGK